MGKEQQATMTKDEIKAKYLRLRGTYATLVGTLYPSIAYQELMNLRAQYVEGTDAFWGDLPTVGEPGSDGKIRPWT